MGDKKEFLKSALARAKDMHGPPAPIVPFADWDFYYVTGRRCCLRLVPEKPPAGPGAEAA